MKRNGIIITMPKLDLIMVFFTFIQNGRCVIGKRKKERYIMATKIELKNKNQQQHIQTNGSR